MIIYRFKKNLLKLIISKSKNVKFYTNVTIDRNTIFEGSNAIFNNTIVNNSYIGFASYIANNSTIKKTKIGRYCAIGDNVRTMLGIHPSKDFVSIHPAFFSTAKQSGFTFTEKQLFEEHKYVDDKKKYVVEIGNDVWIGNNVMIMDGITIGDGAIIAGGAVVTNDVKPYSIVGGIPAKFIKSRFEESEIEFLLSFKWWDKSYDWIKENCKLFRDIKQFMKDNKNGK